MRLAELFVTFARSQPRATSLGANVLASPTESHQELNNRGINQSLTKPADP